MSVEIPEPNDESTSQAQDAREGGEQSVEVTPAPVEVTPESAVEPSAPIVVPAAPVVAPVAAASFCTACGNGLVATAAVCPNCGTPTRNAGVDGVSPKSRTVASLLCFFFGVIGVHRFYVGKVGTGIAMIFTLGGLGVWALIDLIMILVGSFRDMQGRELKNWS